MQRICFSLISLVCAGTACAQEIQYLVKPDNAFSSISSFSEGMARVLFWGSRNVSFIDTSGKTKSFIETYDDAGNFHNGLVWVAKEIKGATLYGFMNKDGELVIPYQYDEVEDFSCNRTAVHKDGAWQVIDKSGKTIMGDSSLITEMEVDDAAAQTKRWEDIEPPAFHDGLMLIRRGEKYGYADTSGKAAIPFQYYRAFDFSEGVAVVATDTIDESLPYKGTGWADSLYNSLPPGPVAYKWSVIDTAGHLLYEFKRNESPDLNQYFSESYLSFYNDSPEKWGVISQYGKVVFQPQFDNEPHPFDNGISFVRVHGKQENNEDGYLLTLDTRGKTIAKIPFTNNYGIVYDAQPAFSEGLLGIKINDLWGFTDQYGKIIIPPQFDEVMPFHEGYAIISTRQGEVAVIKNPIRIYK